MSRERRRRQVAARQRRAADIAWAAGYCDGEAHLALIGGSTLGLRIASCTPEPLRRMQALFGGAVRPARRKTERGRVVYLWGIYGQTARSALERLLPHLSEKAEQAALLLTVRNNTRGVTLTRAERDGRKALRIELGRLKRVEHSDPGD